MNESVRIPLRIVGLVLFVGSLVAAVAFVIVGADDVGKAMGQNCRHNNQLSESEWCTWQDALSIMQPLPWITLIGGVLMLVMRPDSAPTPTLNFARSAGGADPHAPRFNRLRAFATLTVIGLIVLNFAGVTAYRGGYKAHVMVSMGKEIRDAPRPNFDRTKVKAPQTDAPRGVARGSLLRADEFRKAMAQIRRAAPAGAEITRLRVAADHIDAEVRRGGRVVTLRKAWNGKAKVVSRAAATDGDTALIAFSELDTAAPQRIARAARNVDYLVLLDVVGLRWNVFLAGGEGQLRAAPDGRQLQKL